MIETPTNAATRQAIAEAHAQRSQATREFWSWVLGATFR